MGIIQRIVGIISFIFRFIIKIIFTLIYDWRSCTVTPVTDELCLKTATELAHLIRSRQVKAVTVMEAYIARAKEINIICNGIVQDRFDDALMEAQEVDSILDSGNIPVKYSQKNAPLLGVPTSVKEAFALKGMPNTTGLWLRKDIRSISDAPVVQRLKEAGAIPYMVTNVSELCMWYESSNTLCGRTCNPYNNTRIVGGSSGGEGCMIAAGAAVMGIGSDIGGSIRMPSFFNGIFGHRPSRGLVPNEGQFPIPTGRDMELLSTGPMCRYAADLLPLLKIFAGPQASVANLDKKVDIKKIKFYYMLDDGGSMLVSPVDPQLKNAHIRVVKYLQEKLGAAVQAVDIWKMKYSVEIWNAKMVTSGGTPFANYMANNNGSLNCYLEFLKWMCFMSKHTLPAIALGMIQPLGNLNRKVNEKMLTKANELDNELTQLLGNDGVLLYPSHPKIAPYHNEPILYPFNFAYTGIFNALGYPVTQCPLGLSKEGLPLGIQVVAAMNNDHLTIAVANFIEKVFGGWVNPGKK